MRISVIIFLSMTIGLHSCGQDDKSTSNKDATPKEIIDTVILDESKIKTNVYSDNSDFHTEADYTDSTGKGIIIQNGYPRGGGTIYTPSEPRQYGHAVFWSRIVNKTDKPLEIDVHFPPDSFLVYPSAHAHFKLLVPPNVMTSDQISVFSYGFEDINTFVENNFYKPSQIQRTILPNEESMFYVILLSHLPTSDRGVSRTGLFLEGENLYYRLTSALGVKLMHCGQITFQE